MLDALTLEVLGFFVVVDGVFLVLLEFKIAKSTISNNAEIKKQIKDTVSSVIYITIYNIYLMTTACIVFTILAEVMIV